MASPFMNQMSARTQGWRDSYAENQTEYRHIGRYVGYGLLVMVVARVIIEISRHITILMPLGIVAALIFSAFELALAAAGVILAFIAAAAVVGLTVGTGLRLLGLRR